MYVVTARSIWELRRLESVRAQMRQQVPSLICVPIFAQWMFFLWGKANELGQGFAAILSWAIIIGLMGLGTIAGFIALAIMVLVWHGLQYLFKHCRVWEFLELLFLPFVRLGRNAFGDAEKAQGKNGEVGRNAEAEEIHSLINN
jgi:hypothetical protein